jgi:hypothetical protein
LESIKIIQNALRLGNYPRETFRLKPGVYVNDFAFVAKQTIEAYRAWLSEENWFAQHIRVPDIVEELRLLAEETQVLLTPSPS